MTLYEQDCQGTPGNNVTAGTSGYDLVNPSSSAGVRYSDDVENPCHGGSVIRFDGTLGAAAEVRWTPPGTTTAAQSVVVMFTDKPAGGGGVLDFLWARGTVINATARLMEATDGRMRLYRRGSSVSGADVTSATLTGLLNTWLVIDLAVALGTNTTDGTLRWRVRQLDDLDGTPIVQYDATNVDVGQIGTHVMDLFQLGKTSSSGNIAPFYVADHRLDDTTSAFLPDPVLHTEPDTPALYLATSPTTSVPAEFYYATSPTTSVRVDIA